MAGPQLQAMNGSCNYLSVGTHFSSDSAALHCVDKNNVTKLDRSDTVEIKYQILY